MSRAYHHRSFIFAQLLGFAFILLPNIVVACALSPKPTVLQAYKDSEVVVIARAISFEKLSDQSEMPFIGTRVFSTTMEVTKVFKGKLRAGDKMVFGQGNSIRCTWVFDEDAIGKEYLFYLHSPPEGESIWYEYGLGRSHRLEYAADDLLYLNKMDKVRGRTRVSGVLDVDGDGLSSEGQGIRIIGRKRTYVATTDKNGVYELYDVPPGRYVLAPQLKPGWKVEEFRLTRPFTRSELMNERKPSNRVAFTLRPGRHFGVDLRLELSNYVSGTIHDSTSKPMESVCVSFVPVNDDRSLACNSLTDKLGRFQIDSVEAGSYLIILNHENKPTAAMPFSKLYYPGVTDRDQAKVITVKHAEVVTNLKVVIQN